jgi:hypothetical protein
MWSNLTSRCTDFIRAEFVASGFFLLPNEDGDLSVRHKKIMNIICRPKPVYIIAITYIALAVIYLGYLLITGIVYKTTKFNMSGEVIGSGLKIDVFWIMFYAIGAGVMRGGKFARIVACVIGLIAFVVPGIVFIYYLFFTEAKIFFENKSCGKCGPTKYVNKGALFRRLACKGCGANVELKNA